MYCRQIKNLANCCLTRSLLFASIILSFIVTVPFCPAAFARTPLTGSDLMFVGAFAMPRLVGDNAQTPYGNGLALRRVNGQVRLFSTAYKSGDPNTYPLYEVTVPTLKTSGPWNEAPVAKAWGDVLSSRTGIINGLYWDETDKRLYYSSSWNYVTNGDPFLPSLAFLTISTDETSTTSHGQWGFNNRSFKQVNFGVTPVPTDFATQYLGGKRLAAGFGGAQSAAGFGPISMGPSLTAFSPPTVGTEGSYISNIPLVGYGGSHIAWTTGSRPTVDRCWRDDDVIHDIYGNLNDPDNSTNQAAHPSGWQLTGDESFYWQGYSINGSSRASLPPPNNVRFPDSAIKTKHWQFSNAFWNTDSLAQSGAWIQTSHKEGLLLLGTFDTGHVWYWNSGPNAEGIKHKWLIYSRDQIASVAQGTVREDQIQPARYDADFSFSGVPNTRTGYPHWGTPNYTCTGIVFDPVDNRLYVALQYASNAPISNMNSTHLIYVYKINDTVLPPAPTNLRNATK